MRKLTYAEKPRIRLYNAGIGYIAEYIGPRSNHRWRGVGFTPTGACDALRRLLDDYEIGKRQEYNNKHGSWYLHGGPDIGLGPSDHHIATPNRPWWRRLFRV